MDLGFIIEASWVEIEGCLTINYKHNESGYKQVDMGGPPGFWVELVQVQVHFKFKVKKFSKVEEAESKIASRD